MIIFHNVSKSFGGKTVLKNVSFKISSHESVAILGPSGSGKTTILKLMAKTLEPDSGIVEIHGERIGYVFQDHRLLPWRTALDNIMLVLKSAGLDQTRAREKAIAWIRLMKLNNYINFYPRQLSGGMMQRVSIARALAIEPEVILMDEPFSNLDTSLADSLLRQLKKVLANYRTTTVYVSHDIVGALSIAQRLFVLSEGNLVEYPIEDRRQTLLDNLEKRLKGIID